MHTTPIRSARTSPNVRVSPYPARNRTPTRGSPSHLHDPPGENASVAARSTSDSPDRITVALFRDPVEHRESATARVETTERTETIVAPATQHASAELFQLLVKPIVKLTIGQRETSGQPLADTVVTGTSFTDIVQRLWALFRDRMKARAVRIDDQWSAEVPDVSNWSRMFQLKINKHLVDVEKTEHAWNVWLQRNRGKTVQLLIYEYGTAITSQQQLEAFLDAAIRPQQTDRAGATAEVSLREVVHRLQDHWQGTFQAEAVVWRMWGNHITRNLNRSTWDEQISQPPPPYISHLLRVVDNQLEQHLVGMTRSAHLALDCVDASIVDLRRLQDDWEVFGRRLDGYQRSLSTRKAVIQAFIRDVLPPSREDVVDPQVLLRNAEDVDHAE